MTEREREGGEGGRAREKGKAAHKKLNKHYTPSNSPEQASSINFYLEILGHKNLCVGNMHYFSYNEMPALSGNCVKWKTDTIFWECYMHILMYNIYTPYFQYVTMYNVSMKQSQKQLYLVSIASEWWVASGNYMFRPS